MPDGPSARSRRRLLALLGACVSLLAPMVLLVPASGQTATPTPTPTPTPYWPTPGKPVPTTPAVLGEGIDGLADYQGQTVCSPAAKPGTLRLAALLSQTYGIDDIGIPRACSDGGQSEHKEGRALDWMVSMRVPAERVKAEAFLAWLLAPDAQGRPAAMAQRLGVMYIGWNSRIWRSYKPQAGWQELKGCYGKPSTSYDTYCHRDHVHLTLSWDAASARTSFWGVTPDPRPMCPRPSGSSPAPPAVVGSTVVPVTAVRLADTRTGKGAGGSPCRLGAARFSGDARSLRFRATGVGAVPATGVGAVRLAVSVQRTNAPTTVSVRPSGGSARTARGAVQVAINASRSGSVVVPVGSDGYVSLTTSAGATDVVVSVTGYVASVPQPTTTTAPTASPPVSPAPPAAARPAGVAPWPGVPLRLGMRGPSVISLQKGLLARGYGIPTLAVATPRFGTYDAATKAAVARWQRRHARYGAADGIVRAAVYAALTAPVPAAPPPVTPVSTTPPTSPAGVAPWPGVSLRQGMRGPSIASWQRALIARGYRIATLAAAGASFGTFDAATHAATVAFQRATPALGAADGVVGPRTYAYLTAFRA